METLGEFWLLDHERQMIVNCLAKQETNLVRIANEVGDAMGQSSESWHDNAPADALFEELARTRGIIAELRNIYKKAKLAEYPDPREPYINIGSHALLHIRQWQENLSVVVVGDVRHLYSSDTMIEGEELMLTTLNSPIGCIIAGAKTGDVVSGHINGSNNDFEILSVDQNLIHVLALKAVDQLVL
jgi:transcription elongation GreA/GreB family factor